MKKRITIISVFVLIAVGVIAARIFLKDDQGRTISTSGIVEGTEVNISSKVPGRISWICCMEGDAAERDAEVIRLESDEIRASVEQAEASLQRAGADVKSAVALAGSAKAELATAEADVKNTEAEIEKAKVQMKEARLQMERVVKLSADGLVSKADEDRAVAAFESLRAAHEATLAQLAAMQSRREQAVSQQRYARTQIESAEAALALQRARHGDTLVRTPVPGTVVYRAMEPGEYVSPGLAIITIVDMDDLRVRIDVEESRIGLVHPDSEARITVDGLHGNVLKGKITKIGRYAEFASLRDVRHGVQDIKTFHVEIAVEDPDRILKPGMTVNAEIPVGTIN